jgi:hypothetical protein
MVGYQLKNKTFPTIPKLFSVLKSAIQSSAFISVLIGSIWYAICRIRQLCDSDGEFPIQIAAIICGFSVFLEQKHRRKELALYCAPKALESLILRKNWALSYGLERTMLSIGFGYMYALQSNNKEFVSKHMRRGLEFVFPPIK